MNMKRHLTNAGIGTLVGVMGMAGIAVAGSVDVNTPNVRVQVGTPAPPPPRVIVVEPERVIVPEYGERHDQGKHKGHYKKHKKYKKEKKEKKDKD
jgi:hypothetical protein